MNPAQSWYQSRTYRHQDFPAERIAAERSETVTVCVPTRECAGTIGPIVETLLSLQERNVIDGVLVVDARSSDGTADVAARAGADVRQEATLLPEYGRVLGKGDALWRSLSAITTDVVAFVDADTEEFGDHFVCGLLGPLASEPRLSFIKGFYRRPFKADGVALREGGGRVTELTARPLLNMFYPDLAGFQQPLAGEMAGKRDLFERIPWACGYAVETAMLIDVYRDVGLDALAQVDLEVRQNRHQSLARLGYMGYAVLAAAASRLEREGRLDRYDVGAFLSFQEGKLVAREMELVERPPMAEVRAGARTV
jgi:glucosyl-3-phosphoglycerate synthase